MNSRFAGNIGWLLLTFFVGPGRVLAKDSAPRDTADSPRVETNTVYFRDVSAYFYGQMPFLKRGLKFLDFSTSLEVKEGDTTSLQVEWAASPTKDGSSGIGKPVRETKDFAPLVQGIKSRKDAYAYALFFSRKGYPWMEILRFDYFKDVPFIGLEFVKVSSNTLARHHMEPPRITESGRSWFRKNTFTVVRPVVPLDQPMLTDEKLLSAGPTITIPFLGVVTETVGEDGSYSFVLRRVAVTDCVIQNPLIDIRKKEVKKRD